MKVMFTLRRLTYPEEFPDYYDIINDPINLVTIEDRNDAHHYTCFQHFFEDLELLFNNTKLYYSMSHVTRARNKVCIVPCQRGDYGSLAHKLAF